MAVPRLHVREILWFVRCQDGICSVAPLRSLVQFETKIPVTLGSRLNNTPSQSYIGYLAIVTMNLRGRHRDQSLEGTENLIICSIVRDLVALHSYVRLTSLMLPPTYSVDVPNDSC